MCINLSYNLDCCHSTLLQAAFREGAECAACLLSDMSHRSIGLTAGSGLANSRTEDDIAE